MGTFVGCRFYAKDQTGLREHSMGTVSGLSGRSCSPWKSGLWFCGPLYLCKPFRRGNRELLKPVCVDNWESGGYEAEGKVKGFPTSASLLVCNLKPQVIVEDAICKTSGGN